MPSKLANHYALNRYGSAGSSSGISRSYNKPYRTVRSLANMRRRSTFHRGFERFSDTTTIHSLIHYSQERNHNRCLSVLWILLTIGGFASALLLSVRLIVLYRDSPTLTNIKLEAVDELAFPNFTVCLQTRVDYVKLKSALDDLSIVDEVDDTVMSDFMNFVNAVFFSKYSSAYLDFDEFKAVNTSLNIQLYDRLISGYSSGNGKHPTNRTLLDLLESVSPSCDHVFLGCFIEWNQVDCCKLTRMYLLHNGPCFEFGRLLASFRQLRAGVMGGLAFLLQFPADQVITRYNSFFHYGIQIFMSAEAAAIEQQPIYAAPGSYLSIELEQKRTSRLHRYSLMGFLAPDPVCFHTSDLPKLEYYDFYSYASCEYECHIKYQLVECGCVTPNSFLSNSHLKPEQFCGPLAAVDCSKRITQAIQNVNNAAEKSNISFEHQCVDRCLHLCDTISFDARVSTVPFPIPHIKARENLRNQAWYQQARDRSVPIDDEKVIVLQMFYPNLQYTQVSQVESTTAVALLSNIGGSFGLFLGASLVTFVHALFFCLRKLCTPLRKRFYSKLESMIEARSRTRTTMPLSSVNMNGNYSLSTTPSSAHMTAAAAAVTASSASVHRNHNKTTLNLDDLCNMQISDALSQL